MSHQKPRHGCDSETGITCGQDKDLFKGACAVSLSRIGRVKTNPLYSELLWGPEFALKFQGTKVSPTGSAESYQIAQLSEIRLVLCWSVPRTRGCNGYELPVSPCIYTCPLGEW